MLHAKVEAPDMGILQSEKIPRLFARQKAKAGGALSKASIDPVLCRLEMDTVPIIQRSDPTGANTASSFVRVGLVGLLHQQTRFGGPCPSKAGILRKGLRRAAR
jgi:hypothetical protein